MCATCCGCRCLRLAGQNFAATGALVGFLAGASVWFLDASEEALTNRRDRSLLRRTGELIADSVAGQARVLHAARRILKDALALRDQRDQDLIDAEQFALRVTELGERTDKLLQMRPTHARTAGCWRTCGPSASTCSHPGALGPPIELEQLGDLGHPGALADLAVLADRRPPRPPHAAHATRWSPSPDQPRPPSHYTFFGATSPTCSPSA